MKQPSLVKLNYLHESKLLPLHPHQAYGTLLYKTRRIVDGFNPITKETVKCERSVYVKQSGRNVLNLMKECDCDLDRLSQIVDLDDSL